MTTEIDYQSFTTITTSKAERRKLNIGDIYSNAAKCLKCNTVIRSKNRHDYVTCPCGALSVDGGSWYTKRTFTDCNYQELAQSYADVVDKRTSEGVERERVLKLLASEKHKALNEKEACIMHLRYHSVGVVGTMRAIAEVFGISRQRVRQIVFSAIRKMEAYGQ